MEKKFLVHQPNEINNGGCIKTIISLEKEVNAKCYYSNII